MTPAPESPRVDVTSFGSSLPDVLLPYQKRLLVATSQHKVTICEKSRRIGATWGIGADAVLTAASHRKHGGMDVFYIGYNLDMAREFIDTCAMWARAFVRVAAEVREFLFKDQDDSGADRDIAAYRITLASGFEVCALSSRPRSLRGRQGYVIIDEAAFHDDLAEMRKAAFALLMWGGKVLFISTHDGVENAFNELLEETRKGTLKHKPAILTITFEDALRDGLYQRICLTKGERWTEDGERAWAQEIRDFYGDDATEELDCIPKASGGRYLARTLLEARAVRVPVVRWALRPEFVDQPEEARIRTVETFCRDQLAPLVAALPADSRSFLGTDFARSGDVSVDWPLVLLPDLRRHTPFVVELRNVPFTSQWQIVKWLGEHLPRFSGAAFDATGNGAYLAEQARQHWGSECVDEVKVSRGWYLENMPPMKSALEESLLDIPADADVVDDFRAIEVIDGVPRIPDHARAKTSTGQRHGDTAFAACLAYSASRKLDAGPLIFAAEGELRSSAAFNDDAGPGHGLTGWLQ